MAIGGVREAQIGRGRGRIVGENLILEISSEKSRKSCVRIAGGAERNPSQDRGVVEK